jgi:hypothetical protein
MSGVNIGSMGSLAPGPPPLTGRIVGVAPALHYGPIAVAVGMGLSDFVRAQKDFNDSPAQSIFGTSNGLIVKSSPRAASYPSAPRPPQQANPV